MCLLLSIELHRQKRHASCNVSISILCARPFIFCFYSAASSLFLKYNVELDGFGAKQQAQLRVRAFKFFTLHSMIVHHRNNRALYAFKLNIKLQFTCLTLSDPYSG